jgi:hypothetical protein
MLQGSAGRRVQWRGYLTVLFLNHANMKSISILTTVIYQMIKFDGDQPRDCLCKEVNWMLDICYPLSTLSVLDFDYVHQLPRTLPQEKDSYCLLEGNQ